MADCGGCYHKHTFQMAAAMAYYFVLSLFPALILLSAIASYVPVENLFDQALAMFGAFVPADGMRVVRHILAQVVVPNRGAIFLFGILGTLWTASTGFASAIEALDIAYEVEEGRPFWVTRPVALGLVFMVGVLMLIALLVMIAGPHFAVWLSHYTHLSSIFLKSWPYIHWSVSFGFAVLGVELLYFIAPREAAPLEYAAGRHSFRDCLGRAFLWTGRLLSQLCSFQQDLRRAWSHDRVDGMALLEWFYHAGRRRTQLPARQRDGQRQNPAGRRQERPDQAGYRSLIPE